MSAHRAIGLRPDDRAGTPVRVAEAWPDALAPSGLDFFAVRRQGTVSVIVLLPHQHAGGLTLEIDIRLAADVDGDAPDRAPGERVRAHTRVV